ncbi:hypothetical protein LJC16_01585 [Bacteroidales bacterium OttesenSCG-928-C19]|nr:hypothetical protein [Bacteroidales bacterium OttesenSCG-928-C19]
MSNKNINRITLYILPVVVFVITVVLFFMFKPEETTSLFYINLGYTLLLEAIFFGYFNLLHVDKKDASTVFFAVFGVYALYYVIFGAAWMLVYSLILSHFTVIKIYITVLLVVTLLWIILSLLTLLFDSNYKQIEDKEKEKRISLNFYVQKMNLLATRYERACQEKGIKYETHSNNATVLDKLKNKVNSLHPRFVDNAAAVSQLISILDKCETMIEETENSKEENALSELSKKMQRFTDNAIMELDMFNNLSKR